MTGNYKSFLTEDRRLCTLRILQETGGSANDSILHTALERLGHNRVPRSEIRSDLRFLIKHGLLVEEWYEDVMVVTITQRGVEVARGAIAIDGIKRPSIGV